MQQAIDTDPTLRDWVQLLMIAELIRPWLLWSLWIDKSVSNVRFGIWKEHTCKMLLNVTMKLVAKFIKLRLPFMVHIHWFNVCTASLTIFPEKGNCWICTFFRNPMSAFLRWSHICNIYCLQKVCNDKENKGNNQATCVNNEHQFCIADHISLIVLNASFLEIAPKKFPGTELLGENCILRSDTLWDLLTLCGSATTSLLMTL